MHSSRTLPLPDVADRHEALNELVLALLAAVAYFGVRNLTAGSPEVAFANADRLSRVEHALRIAWESRVQERVLDVAWLVTAGNWIYIWGHWPVIITVAVLLHHYRPDRYRLLRTAILISAAIGFVFFAFFPVAPPRLVDPSLVDTVTLHSEAYRALQPPGFTNQFAAFPSLHVGWNLLVGIALWGATRNPLVRAFAALAPLAMAVAVVATANHYVIDVAGGLAAVLIGLFAARRVDS